MLLKSIVNLELAGMFPVHVTFKCHFAALFRLKRVAISFSLTSSEEQECCLSFTWKAGSQRLLFVRSVRHLSHWSVERQHCSSLERVFTLTSSWYHSHDVSATVFTYVKRSFWFFVVHVCKILQQLSAIGRFSFLMKYRHSFATVIPLNHFVHHEISQLHCNKPSSKQRAIMVKSWQVQCKHSCYGVKL